MKREDFGDSKQRSDMTLHLKDSPDLSVEKKTLGGRAKRHYCRNYSGNPSKEQGQAHFLVLAVGWQGASGFCIYCEMGANWMHSAPCLTSTVRPFCFLEGVGDTQENDSSLIFPVLHVIFRILLSHKNITLDGLQDSDSSIQFLKIYMYYMYVF